MFKLFTTLMRGTLAEAEEAAFDHHATRVLAQQLRDAAASLEIAKKELACAMAHRSSEASAVTSLNERIAILEAAAVEALDGDRDDLAEESATLIASLEDERADRQKSVGEFENDIAHLRRLTEEGQRRLRDLARGLETARAREALSRAGANGRRALVTGSGALREAEETLDRIRKHQRHDDDKHAALEELERTASGRDLFDRLAAEGFGPNPKTTPGDVLARLKNRANKHQSKSSPADDNATNKEGS